MAPGLWSWADFLFQAARRWNFLMAEGWHVWLGLRCFCPHFVQNVLWNMGKRPLEGIPHKRFGGESGLALAVTRYATGLGRRDTFAMTKDSMDSASSADNPRDRRSRRNRSTSEGSSRPSAHAASTDSR